MGPKSPSLVARYRLEGKKVLMTLGRMSANEKYKGFDEVLEVLPDLIKKSPKIVYMAVGDGDDCQRLKAKAEKLRIADHFILTGFVKEEEKADYYRLADVYLMLSSGEGFGYVILEALACGVPVIGSISDGTQEALRFGELGQMVDPKKTDQIKLAILKALKMHKTIPKGLEYFSYNNYCKRLYGIIKSVINF